MITGLNIENFKGIGAQGIHLDLRPVTMLFGANSAGKTTILHAILLASEVLLNRNCNPDRTGAGGESVDLGGFRTFVHKHDVKNDIKLGFNLAFENEAFEEDYFIEPLFVDRSTGQLGRQGMRDCYDLCDVGEKIKTGTVELLIRWDSKTQLPYVRSYKVTLDGHFFGDLVYDPQSGNLCIQDLNLSHPALLCHDAPSASNISIGIADLLCPELRTALEESFYPVSESLLDWLELPIRVSELDTVDPASRFILRNPACDPTTAAEFSVRKCVDAEFEDCRERAYEVVTQRNHDGSFTLNQLRFSTSPESEWIAGPCDEDSPTDAIDDAAYSIFNAWLSLTRSPMQRSLPVWQQQGGALPSFESRLHIDYEVEHLNIEVLGLEARARLGALTGILSRLLLVPGRILARELESLRYLGPLRTVPDRTYTAPLTPDRARWADGMAAWDELVRSPETFANEVSNWLSEPARMGTGYTLQRKRHKKVDLASPMLEELYRDKEGVIEKLTIIQHLQKFPDLIELVFRDEDTLVEVSPKDIAIGITQLIPVIVAALHGDSALTFIEQPELHNHPAIEVALGDLFISSIRHRSNRCFILETHGEHLILRLLRRIRETAADELPPTAPPLNPSDIAVYHVKRISGELKIQHIRVDETGEFIDKWPGGFFEERGKELF